MLFLCWNLPAKALSLLPVKAPGILLNWLSPQQYLRPQSSQGLPSYLSFVWKESQMRNTIWKHFPEHPFLLDFFSYTKEEIIQYANNETDIESKTFEEAVYYLAKEGIGMPTEHFKKEASVRYRGSEGMYEELKSGVQEADVWEYGNGAYAGMLIVSK